MIVILLTAVLVLASVLVHLGALSRLSVWL